MRARKNSARRRGRLAAPDRRPSRPSDRVQGPLHATPCHPIDTGAHSSSSRQEAPIMKTLVLANQKGGVGKSAVATLLAHYFAQHGQRTLAIDLDHQGNFSKPLRLSDRAGVVNGQCRRVDDIDAGRGARHAVRVGAQRCRPARPGAAADAAQHLRPQLPQLHRRGGFAVRCLRDRHQPEPGHPADRGTGLRRLRVVADSAQPGGAGRCGGAAQPRARRPAQDQGGDEPEAQPDRTVADDGRVHAVPARELHRPGGAVPVAADPRWAAAPASSA